MTFPFTALFIRGDFSFYRKDLKEKIHYTLVHNSCKNDTTNVYRNTIESFVFSVTARVEPPQSTTINLSTGDENPLAWRRFEPPQQGRRASSEGG
jgi:hypothetical protein